MNERYGYLQTVQCISYRSIAELQASLSQSDMSLEEAMSKVLDLMRENQDLKGLEFQMRLLFYKMYNHIAKA